MYLWRKTASPRWLNATKEVLEVRAQGKLVIVARPTRKWLQVEVASLSCTESRRLVEKFGGHSQKLPHDWRKQFARVHQSQRLKVGKRLIVGRTRSRDFPAAAATVGKPSLLVIPASVAFGTGEHATTAMSLRLLEQLTRHWNPDWSMVDLGTGSGILALAAKRFGAGHTLAIDNDPLAISAAKANARFHKIDGVDFRVGDLRNWRPSRKIDIVTANLFSELLTEILSKLKRCNWLILSGVLRDQEKEFLRALRYNKIGIVEVRHRGKWVAVLAAAGLPSSQRKYPKRSSSRRILRRS